MRQKTALALTLSALSLSPALACPSGGGGGTIYVLMFMVMYGFPASLIPAFVLAVTSKRADRWFGFVAGVILAFGTLCFAIPNLNWDHFVVAGASLLALMSGAGVAPALLLRYLRPDQE